MAARISNKAWYIGYTTIRNPLRLKFGLAVLAESPLHGNLDGRDNENAFARLLHESNVARLARLEANENSDVRDVGRKWRAAMQSTGWQTVCLQSRWRKGDISTLLKR